MTTPPPSTSGGQAQFPPGHPLAGLEDQVDRLRDCGRDFYGRGWSLGTSSNYSVVIGRRPLELLVTASGKDKGQLLPDDFVRVDATGQPVVTGQPKSSAETLLHTVLAQNPEVGAVLHTHSVWSTVLSEQFAAAGGIEISGYEMLKGLAGVATHEHSEWIAILENSQDIPALSSQLEAMLDEPGNRIAHGFLLRRHGLYTWGRDLAEARRHIEIIEFLLECVARTQQLSATAATSEMLSHRA